MKFILDKMYDLPSLDGITWEQYCNLRTAPIEEWMRILFGEGAPMVDSRTSREVLKVYLTTLIMEYRVKERTSIIHRGETYSFPPIVEERFTGLNAVEGFLSLVIMEQQGKNDYSMWLNIFLLCCNIEGERITDVPSFYRRSMLKIEQAKDLPCTVIFDFIQPYKKLMDHIVKTYRYLFKQLEVKQDSGGSAKRYYSTFKHNLYLKKCLEVGINDFEEGCWYMEMDINKP